MAITPSGIVTVLLLFTGLVIAYLEITKEQHEVETENRVATPMIGMSKRQGPWPTCEGMDGDKCCEYIENLAKDIRGNCIVVGENEMVTGDFNEHRVRVFVDEDNVVTAIPDRG